MDSFVANKPGVGIGATVAGSVVDSTVGGRGDGARGLAEVAKKPGSVRGRDVGRISVAFADENISAGAKAIPLRSIRQTAVPRAEATSVLNKS